MAIAGRATAALVLGLPLAVGLLGLAMLVWPGRLATHALPLLLLFFPTWVGVMAAAFAFATGGRAWLGLGGATLLVFALIAGCKHFGWVGLPA